MTKGEVVKAGYEYMLGLDVSKFDIHADESAVQLIATRDPRYGAFLIVLDLDDPHVVDRMTQCFQQLREWLASQGPPSTVH